MRNKLPIYEKSTALVGHGSKRHIVTQYSSSGRYFAVCGTGENSTLIRRGRLSVHSIKDFDIQDVTCTRCKKNYTPEPPEPDPLPTATVGQVEAPKPLRHMKAWQAVKQADNRECYHAKSDDRYASLSSVQFASIDGFDYVVLHAHLKVARKLHELFLAAYPELVYDDHLNSYEQRVMVYCRPTTAQAETATIVAPEIAVVEKPAQIELPLVGDTVVYNGDNCKIIHVIPEGQDGQPYIGIRTKMKVKKGWSSTIITRPAAEFQVSLQAVA